MALTSPTSAGQPTGTDQPRTGVLLLAVLVAFCAQQVLLPALAPFARETGLTETQLGLTIGVAAAVLVLAAPWWARRCTTLGPRAVLVTGLTVALAGLTAFGAVATLALAGDIDPTLTFVLMLATRGVLFGAGLAAVPVAALAIVVAGSTAQERTGAVGKLGAAQGLAIVLGPAIGAVVAFAGLLGPVWAAPAAVLAALLLMIVLVPPSVVAGPPPGGGPARLRPWDPRVRSVLLVGFLLYTGLGLVLLTIGFAVQDRGGLDADAAARVTGAIIFACGLVLAASQGVLVPKVRWKPRRLMMVGTPIAAAGLLGIAVVPGVWGIGAAMLVVAAGMGIATPGYTAAPSMVVEEHEQASAAGLLTATNGLAFVAGPALGGALYAVSYPLPFAVAGIMVLLGLMLLLADRGAAAEG
ncbi:MFS transporter [Solwaraspora sp. WMMD406]|uniref:MFS transporter n=1 Tax=Solwaraspora sp. WMMD406 TaxID=3016095 RepID=UPI002417F466|nr:MFS transporter [Solwaraspora sp. WMMD406]MDG4765871.1 MFS transporter [Solwaraspora sp. WMMD406]